MVIDTQQYSIARNLHMKSLLSNINLQYVSVDHASFKAALLQNRHAFLLKFRANGKKDSL